MRKQEQRKIKLLEMLRLQQRLNISNVTSELDISEATARRLFTELEKTGKLLRVHGGIQAAPELNSDYSFRFSAAQNTAAKEAIGRTAAAMVKSGSRLFLDAGTTVLKMAEALSLRLQTGEVKNITAITNSLSFLPNLAEHCEVILLGGRLRAGRHDVCGSLTRQNLKIFHCDQVFLGIDAISADGQLMTTDTETAEINSLFIEQAKESYILADASKFKRTSFCTFADLTAVTALITDSGMSGSQLKSLKKSGVKLIVAP
ncbi:MAG: DeoR/GlpR family DNA-binding transcription regulator [Victivallales bacterium]|nr:DeoR/GlpR family DNA-binding transcription regulator [Victivallales bacterium]